VPPIEVRILHHGDEEVLKNVADDVFDDNIDPNSTRAFLADPRHHLAVALDGDLVVGFASGVHYFHPDKPSPELFVNEVGVAPSHQRRGIAKKTLEVLFEAAREAGCTQAWVLTDRINTAAMRLYRSAGAEADSDHVMMSFSLRRTQK
jgi:ribosomal protein S18 acetylase RimI-like enzyme